MRRQSRLSNWDKHRILYQKLGVGVCVLIGIILGVVWFYHDELPPMSELKNYTMRSGSEVYDRNGKMIYLFAFERRKLVSIRELPPYLIDALIVTEDKNFYRHFGVDLLGNLRALFIDIVRMDFSQGASTITQQMARNMFLTLDKKVSRKIKEVILALRIEQSFSKEEILEIYFNKIFFGGQIYGIETASLFYFGKHARDLTLPESALLIGLIQRPNYYDPRKHKDRAIERRNFVLSTMYKHNKISKAEYEAAIKSSINPEQTALKHIASDYFIETIRQYLERKYGTEKLFEGSLKIYTTLDYNLSNYADSVLNAHLVKLEKSRGYGVKLGDFSAKKTDFFTEYLQGGLVLMENKTGHVRVLIGGRNFNHSKFNRMTLAKRQPGSAFKPIYYTAAVEKGYTPATVLNDAAIIFTGYSGGDWRPQNYSLDFNGFIRMRKAITFSYNLWGVRTVYDLGLPPVSDVVRRYGFNAEVTDYSIALGTYEVIPIQLISAYTAFPNSGYRVKPILIERVEDKKGNVLERAKTVQYKVCEPEVAYIMTSMMQSVVTSGTGTASRQSYNWPVAGKTGTTDDYRDAWFIGFNKDLILGIWTGFDKVKTMGNNMSGGVVCAPVWGSIMRKAMVLDNRGRLPAAEDPRYVFDVPENIIHRTINPVTGYLAEEGIDEVFIQGTEPMVYSDSLIYNFRPSRYRIKDPNPYVIRP
ncbi:MAG: PBP1A family penicillin-binding protein [Candidatus Cloacimonetes bacterium]|nr:PBP1A family penicillin-binding protein [Candidatus Cloacimonadota bacterium]